MLSDDIKQRTRDKVKLKEKKKKDRNQISSIISSIILEIERPNRLWKFTIYSTYPRSLRQN